jgi:hypothetical protein
MSTVKDMVTLILNDPDFQALAGNRLYFMTLPESPTFPAATYFRVSRPHEHTHDGLETVHPRFQFDAYGNTQEDADNLAHILDDIFSRWKSAFGDAAFGEDMRDIAEPDLPPVGERFRVTLDVTIWGLI